MILANVRGRLRAQDFLLVAIALARGDAARRARYERCCSSRDPTSCSTSPICSPPCWPAHAHGPIAGAVHLRGGAPHAARAGVDDRALADYLAALLLEFGDHDRHVRIRRTDDETYHYLVDMVEDLTGLDDAGNGRFCCVRISATTVSGWPACFRTTSPPGVPARAGPTCRTTTSWVDRAFDSRRSTGSPSTSASPRSTAPPPSGSPPCGWRSIA